MPQSTAAQRIRTFPEALGRLVEDAIIVVVIAGHEKDALEPRSRQIGKALHPAAVVEVIFVAPPRIEAGGMTEIASDDEAIARGQGLAEVLPFKMKIAQVGTAHWPPSNRRKLPLCLDPSRLSVKLKDLSLSRTQRYDPDHPTLVSAPEHVSVRDRGFDDNG